MSTKSPSDYKIEGQSFEWKPTGGIQSIADKSFVVTKIESFVAKSGDSMCIVETEETYHELEFKNEAGDKVKGNLNRFFCSPRDLRLFFTNPEIMKSVNEDGEKIKCEIEKIAFDEDSIKRDSSLKSKTHWVFKDNKEGMKVKM